MQQVGLTRTYRARKSREHVEDHRPNLSLDALDQSCSLKGNRDPKVSLKALDQSWKLEGAYTEKHVNLNINYENYDKNIEALDAQIEELDENLRQHAGGIFGPVVTPDETDS